MVGLDAVLQHTPLAVTGSPPSSKISPPLIAELSVITDIAEVVITMTPLCDAKLRPFPYPVPMPLVAYARM